MTYKHTLHIDIESKSGADISATGAYKYALDSEFEILLIAYAVDADQVNLIEVKKEMAYLTLNGQHSVEWCQFERQLKDPDYLKLAYNASFEVTCLNQAGFSTPIEQWQCTMAHAAYCGYPMGLEATGKALGISETKQKLMTGKALIRYFCTPQKATKKNGGRRWNEPHHDLSKWELFKSYCKQDVEAEREIERMLSRYPVPEEEWELWRMDVMMNTRGVRLDRKLIEGALYCNAVSEKALTDEAKRITGLGNPNSTTQLLDWLDQFGCKLPNLQKATVAEALEDDLEYPIMRVLEIRQQLGKTSNKKYQAAMDAICDDDRVRGLSQYYGANRTGRFAGRIIQPQNLTKHSIQWLDTARRLVKEGDYETLKMLHGNVPDILSQLIRTMFIPSEGRKLIAADYSSIEPRNLAYLAREKWVLDAFAEGKDIYCETATRMYHVPVEKDGANSALRQKGKIATLACGYGGGVGALTVMDTKNEIPEEEKQEVVNRYREANKMTTSFWYECEYAALDVVSSYMPKRVAKDSIEFAMEEDECQRFMTIKLPSGRKLYYTLPTIQENRFGKPAVHYYEVNGTTKKWEETSTYGPKLVENIVQAFARDCLAEALRRMHAHGWQVVFHVHDEIVLDVPRNVTVDEVCEVMCEPMPWAPGLLLKAEGFESEYYKKG